MTNHLWHLGWFVAGFLCGVGVTAFVVAYFIVPPISRPGTPPSSARNWE